MQVVSVIKISLKYLGIRLYSHGQLLSDTCSSLFAFKTNFKSFGFENTRKIQTTECVDIKHLESFRYEHI
jgi:hypothetical protein